MLNSLQREPRRPARNAASQPDTIDAQQHDNLRRSSRTKASVPGTGAQPERPAGQGDDEGALAEAASSVQDNYALIVLRSAAEICSVPFTLTTSKEDLLTAMLAKYAPSRLSGGDASAVSATLPSCRSVDKRTNSLEGHPKNEDSFLEAVYGGTNVAGAYCVRREGASWAMHPGDAVQYWEQQGSGPKLVFGAVRGFHYAFLRKREVRTEVVIQRLYRRDELGAILDRLGPCLVEEEPGILDKHFSSEIDVGHNAVVMTVLSDFVSKVPLASITKVHALAGSYMTLESIAMSETSPDEIGSQVAYKSFLQTKTWTLHSIQLPDTKMTLVLKHAALHYRTASPFMVQGALGGIRKHIFSSLSKIGIKEGASAREAILIIPCAFGLFGHVVTGGPPCAMSWNGTCKTWTARFAHASELEHMLGPSWFRVHRPASQTYTEATGSVEIVYSHNHAGKIRFTMRPLAIIAYGGHATVLQPENGLDPAVEGAF
jgi:hypothetical protein